ncbi:MAG: adenine phosphoribosyltransferase [Francisellaceae bacterium]
MRIQRLKELIATVPDFPKPGILFRDITPLLQAVDGLRLTTELMAEKIVAAKLDPTIIAGAESRGFIFGVALAEHLGLGFVPIRKPGKLPRDTYRCSYELEYGQDSLEVHRDAFSSTERVLLVDDLLATGGTASACIRLVEMAGAKVAGLCFVIELLGFDARSQLSGFEVQSLLQY